MRISDWSSDVFSTDLVARLCRHRLARRDDHPRHLLPLAVLTAGPVSHAPSLHAGRRLGKGIGGHKRSDLLRGRRDRRKGEQQGKQMAHRNSSRCVLLTRSEEHTSELQSLMRISYAVFCLKKKKNKTQPPTTTRHNNI